MTDRPPKPGWTPCFDGLDQLSPRAEIEAELRDVEASCAPPDLEHLRQERIRFLRRMLTVATEKGGF